MQPHDRDETRESVDVENTLLHIIAQQGNKTLEEAKKYVEHLEEVIWKNMVILPWKKNDVIALDNFSTAHGRLPYEGKREILVSWST